MSNSNTSATTDELNKILKERGENYGDFIEMAKISGGIKRVLFEKKSISRYGLDPDEREALEIIAHKMSRIVNGNPHFEDSWRDIAGYATLVANRIARDKRMGEDKEARSNG